MNKKDKSWHYYSLAQYILRCSDNRIPILIIWAIPLARIAVGKIAQGYTNKANFVGNIIINNSSNGCLFFQEIKSFNANK